jgi:Asp-tRNA(Asn)/Glu-tRNA(Gln) amidotransferase A subunit family amidase
MGSDTCGTIPIPAALKNLFGLRVTPRVSSRNGVIPLSHTQDLAGPLARSVSDLVTLLDLTVGEDPGDATTIAGRGHVPASYRTALDRDGLRGKRIGLLKNLVEEGEVADINRKALQAMKAAGAEVVEEITIPGLEDLMRDSSAIPHEFKFDLMDYLGRFPNAPVHSLGEILARGDYDKALENTFRTREKPEARDTEASRRARVRREATRAIVFATMEELKLDALAYPPTQRKPAITGEPQGGLSNCQLSASAGFPAMSMPAGFTSDRVPIGIELLGRPWEEPKLLSMAYAYEQAVQPRRAPLATPPLVNGKGPAPRSFRATVDGVRFDFTFDVTTGKLTYVSAAQKPVAAAIHRAGEGDTGPVIARLPDASGSVMLNGAESAALAEQKLYVGLTMPSGQKARAAIAPNAFAR